MKNHTLEAARFDPRNNALDLARSIGHQGRTGHTLVGYWTGEGTLEDPRILTMTCCEVTSSKS